MRIIGVLDLAGGQSVHARAGQREHYAPVQQVAGAPIPPGDARALATAYRDRLGVGELYVADLDAIVAGRPQHALIADLARVAPTWVDAGVTTVNAAHEAIASGARRVVIGLETLSSFDALAEICRTVGGDRTAFSLDLRDGHPLHRIDAIPAGATPVEIAREAVGTGIHTMVVLDLARVGTGRSFDADLLSRLRDALPGIALIVGGGIRGPDDLSLAADAGCAGVLVATALQDGRLTAADIAAARLRHPSASR